MPHSPTHPLPSAAEIARTLVDGVGSATVSGPLGDTHGVSVLHAALLSGDVVLAVPGDARSQTIVSAPPDGLPGAPDDWTISLCVRAQAALADLSVARAHLEVLGWARPVPDDRRPSALSALGRTWPLDALGPALGGYRLLFVEIAECELHWAGGCVTLEGDEVRRARPDPLWRDEADLLERVRAALTGRLLALVQGLGRLHRPDGSGVRLDRTVQVRPVALDRYGLSVQCLDATGARHLLRIPFDRPVEADEDVLAAITTELVSQSACRESCRPSAAAQDAPQASQP